MINKTMNLIKENIKWICFFVCIIIFLKITENIFQNEIHIFDLYVYEAISNFISAQLTIIMKIFTTLGSALVLITIAISSVCCIKKYGRYIGINLLVIFIINQILKLGFKRPRPIDNQIIIENGFSFPSGHSMVSMAFYGLIIYFVQKNVKSKIIKWLISIILIFLIVLIGVSRIYLGVHYASDVIGGFVFSIAYLIFFTHVLNIKR